MFTARAAIRATVTSEIAACRANSSFAQRESGNVSVRNRKHGDQGVKSFDEFLGNIQQLIASKVSSE